MLAEAFAAAIAAQPVPPAAVASLKATLAAETFVISREGTLMTPDALEAALRAPEVVYVGERHDQAAHHQVELEVLKAVHRRRPGVALGLEMLSSDYQGAVDDFVAGRASDAEFKKVWEKAWGFSYELYRPILELARAYGVPVKALNAPRGVIGQIARGGLASLTPEQRAQVAEDILPIPPGKYRDYVLRALLEHDPGMPPEQQRRYLEAMAAWNETMAERLIDSRPLVVLAGSGHVLYSDGIAACAARRGAGAQAVVLPYPPDGERRALRQLLSALAEADERALADYFWLLPSD